MASRTTAFPSFPSGSLAAFALFAFLSWGGAAAQTEKLADANPGAANANPQNFIAYGGFVYYAAESAGTGVELWRSNGLPGGTSLFMDINVGAGSSSPQEFAIVNGLLYFQANNGANGAELWVCDGSLAGTHLVKDIRSGVLGSNPRYITGYQGNLYFQADDGVVGVELWTSDGSAAGTLLVADIQPGTLPIFGPKSSNPADLTDAGGLLFFRADDGVNGVELWAFDGFSAFLVANIFPGVGLPFGTPNSSFPVELTEMGGTLYFVATNSVVGTEVWTSDGTPGGTVPVQDLNPGPASSLANGLVVVNGVLYLSASDGATGEELRLVTDPFSGVNLVADLNPGTASSSPMGITAVGTSFYFSAIDGVHGREPFRSDGTAPGTSLIRDVRPGAASSLPTAFAVLGAGPLAVFRADDGSLGEEPWATDGTPGGTYRITDLMPCAAGSSPTAFTSLGSRAIFAANDGTSGVEAWATDGVMVLATGIGQAPQFGLAVLDVNLSVEAGGAPVCTGRNGPYFTTATAGSLTTMSFAGAPNQPIVLLAGAINPNVVSFGAIGRVDLGTGFVGGVLTGVSVVASGTNVDILSQLFRTSANGSSLLTFTTPSTLLGQSIGFQAFFFNGTPTVVSLSNAVEVTFQ